MPDANTLARYYDEDYYGQGTGKFVGPVERIVWFFRLLRAHAIKRYVSPGRILDVGCGRGLMLSYFKLQGWTVDGIELDTVAAARAQENLGQPIFKTMEEVAVQGALQYDAICFWHSLEHLPNPGKALETARRLLAPGGLLVVSAPHMTSIQSRLSGQSWLHLDIPRHLVHFDIERLAAFLQGSGYELLREQHFSQEYNVIDTLCYLYRILGFDHLYPFNLIRNQGRHRPCREDNPVKTVLALVLMLPLTGIAFFVSNFFSMLESGSTVTLFLRKIS
jgi:SAM-dependent methyltransferase